MKSKQIYNSDEEESRHSRQVGHRQWPVQCIPRRAKAGAAGRAMEMRLGRLVAVVTVCNARQGRLLCKCPDGTVHDLCSEEGCVGSTISESRRVPPRLEGTTEAAGKEERL